VNAVDLRDLVERADGVEGRSSTRLAEVHARVRSARRRRQAGAVVATVVAVLLAITAGTAVVKLTESDPPPVTPPSPIPTPIPSPKVDHDDSDAPAVRRLVYARGSTVHLGDKRIDVGGEVAGVTATDDGAVFTRYRDERGRSCSMTYKCGVLWFTDGTETFVIGHAFGGPIRGWFIDASSAGSTVVWFESAVDDRSRDPVSSEPGEYVVYDTRARREVTRFGSVDSDIKGVYGDNVYWAPDHGKKWCADYSKYYAACRKYRSVLRLDTSTGTRTKVPWSAYLADWHNRPRMFVRQANSPDYLSNPFPSNQPGDEALDFTRDGDRLVVVDEVGDVVRVRFAATGEPVRLRLPQGYDAKVDAFFFESWLDDDRFVLSADNALDLLVCHLSTGRCRLAVEGPTLTNFRGHG
jgi:hypothetical protein